jgi:hypothetical protein
MHQDKNILSNSRTKVFINLPEQNSSCIKTKTFYSSAEQKFHPSAEQKFHPSAEQKFHPSAEQNFLSNS